MDDDINGMKNPIFKIMENFQKNNNSNNIELAQSYQFGSKLENPDMIMSMNNLSVNNNALNNGLPNTTDENFKNISPKTIYFDAYDEIDGNKKKFSMTMFIINNSILNIQLNYCNFEILNCPWKYISRNFFSTLKLNNKIFSSCASLLEIENFIADLVKSKGSTIKIKKEFDNRFILTIPTSQLIQDKLILNFTQEDNQMKMGMNSMNNPMMGMNNMNNPMLGMNNLNDSMKMGMNNMENPMMGMNSMNNQMMGMNNMNNSMIGMNNMENPMMGMNSMNNQMMGMNNMNNPMMGMNNMNNTMMGMNTMINPMMMDMNKPTSGMNTSMMMGINNQINDYISEKEREKTIIEPYEKKIKDLELKLKQQSLEIAELKQKIYQKENSYFYQETKQMPKKMEVKFSRKKKYTNFEEMFYAYKDCKFNKPNEEELIINLKEVYYFYKEKKIKIEEGIKNAKLFLFRFKKAKELIQIYKIFELITDIIDSIIQYNKSSKNFILSDKIYLQVITRAKKIINFQKDEERLIVNKDPELDNIKLFSGDILNNINSKNSPKNLILKTIYDDFEIKRDCHLIKNNTINFIPQIEIIFSDSMNITKELVKEFKKELHKIFEDDNFSVIEINKGSTRFLISLQFIFKKVKVFDERINLKEFFKRTKNKVSEYVDKIKEFDFCFFGKKGNKNKVNAVNEFIKDIYDSEKEIIQKFEEKLKGNPINQNTNFYEAAKSFSMNDFEELINYISQDELTKQEYNQLLKNYEEYYNIFEKGFEKALAFSIFEYQLVKIYTIDRDDYKLFIKNKAECEEVEEKLLFHGTKVEYIASILKTFVDIDRNTCTKLGKGFYLSDLFEVSWRYRNSKDVDKKIPEIGDSFPILVCNTFYSKNNVEVCYKDVCDDNLIPKNHIRIAKVKSDTSIVLTKEELKNYNKYIQNEYLISHQEQVLPIYAIYLRRVEYLIVWRDNNFDKSNPNNYEDFDIMTEFNLEMQNFAYKELNARIYYVKTTEEGLKLIDRKKYNKIIIITNGGNNGEEFIKEARKIMNGNKIENDDTIANCNTIAYVSCYIPENHIDWVSKLPNTLLSDDKKIFQDFLKSAITENKLEMKELKNKIQKKYDKEFKEFNEDTAFVFPTFLKEGTFDDLKFKPEYNK